VTGPEDSQRLQRVETLVAGLVTDVALIKAAAAVAADVATQRAAQRSSMRNWVLAVIVALLAVPATFSASVQAYHLFEPTHTIVQKIDPPSTAGVNP
jgi:hypothetical protein